MKRGGFLERKTPLARGVSQLKRTRIARVGKKGRNDRRELAAVMPLLVERSGGQCEFEQLYDYPDGLLRCKRAAVDAHHVVRRSQGGSNELENLKHLCATHHHRVHANPAWAMEHGYLRSAAA